MFLGLCIFFYICFQLSSRVSTIFFFQTRQEWEFINVQMNHRGQRLKWIKRSRLLIKGKVDKITATKVWLGLYTCLFCKWIYLSKLMSQASVCSMECVLDRVISLQVWTEGNQPYRESAMSTSVSSSNIMILVTRRCTKTHSDK